MDGIYCDAQWFQPSLICSPSHHFFSWQVTGSCERIVHRTYEFGGRDRLSNTVEQHSISEVDVSRLFSPHCLQNTTTDRGYVNHKLWLATVAEMRLLASADFALRLGVMTRAGLFGSGGGLTEAFWTGFGSSLTVATFVATVVAARGAVEAAAKVSGHFHCTITSDTSSLVRIMDFAYRFVHI
jgi:hypothetical protein